jgi:integrase
MAFLILTFNFRFNTFNSLQSKFLVRQAKSGESIWLRSGSAELLGHSDVKTTMIYTHVLNRGPSGVRSPVDGL